MNQTIQDLLDNINSLEQSLSDELHRHSDDLKFEFKKGRVVFEQELKQANQAFRIGIGEYIKNARWLVLLTAPIIYSLLIPFMLLDLFVSIYQAICFPVYSIPKVKRSQYLIFDRLKLDYLNGIEKFNCAYCSYGNGVIAYVQEVAARTEQYWCPIKHARKAQATHSRYPKFTDFGDGEQYRREAARIKCDFED